MCPFRCTYFTHQMALSEGLVHSKLSPSLWQVSVWSDTRDEIWKCHLLKSNMSWHSSNALYIYWLSLFVCACVHNTSNEEKAYLDILSIGIIKSCLLELISADRSVSVGRRESSDVCPVRWREPVCKPLIISTTTFSPLPPWFSRYLTHFLSVPRLLSPIHSFYTFISFKHTVSCICAHTSGAKLKLPVQSQTQKSPSFIQMTVYFFYCQVVCFCRERDKMPLSVCTLVYVTCTAEGEGLTVGDKPDRPARCDYHPPDPLSLSHTHTSPMRECVARI